MLNNVTSSNFVNSINGFTGAVSSAMGGTNSTVNNTYGTDGYTQTNNYSTASVNSVMSYPISQIIAEDPAMASRFGKFFLSNSDRFLRVGTSWLGKAVINLMAGNIPLLTSKSVSTQISNNLNLWLGRSDLVRTGMNPYHAILLQDVGIKNVNDLAIIANPADQAVLAQMMNAASVTRGQPILVDGGMISQWSNTARQLPKYF